MNTSNFPKAGHEESRAAGRAFGLGCAGGAALIAIPTLLVLLLGTHDMPRNGGSPSSSTAPARFGDNFSVEQKLAVLDSAPFALTPDHQVLPEQMTVNRIRALLSQLSETFPESREQIADITVAAEKTLADDGIRASILNMLEAMNQVFPPHTLNQKYSDTLAMYTVLRKKGMSHEDAAKGLAELARGLIEAGRTPGGRH